MNESVLSKWAAGVASVLVCAALLGVWSTMQNLTVAVSDLRTTNAEVRGAIEKLAGQLESSNRLADQSIARLERQFDQQSLRAESLEKRVRSLEQSRGGGAGP
jgi:predicted RNase H-like nuclease (RuvC/YqgF family)